MMTFQSRLLATATGLGLVLTLLAAFPKAQEPKTEKAQEPQPDKKGASQAVPGADRAAFPRRMVTEGFVRHFEMFPSGVDLEKELQINPEQKSRLDAILTRVRTETSDLYGARGARPARGAPGYEAQLKGRLEARGAIYERAANEIKAALTKQQLARIDQIDLQDRLRSVGLGRGLSSGTVSQTLKITQEQAAKLREAENKAQEQFVREMENLRLLQLESLAEARRKVLSVLTAEQRAEYERLTGTPLPPDERALEYGVAGMSARLSAERGFRGSGGFGALPFPRAGRGNAETAPPAGPPPADPKP